MKNNFSEELIKFSIVSELWEKNLGFGSILLGELSKLHLTVLIHLNWKNYILIHLFRVFSRKKMTLAKLHQADCQNCILCVNETLRGKINLLKNGYVLFIFFGLRLEKKLESSENFGKVVKAAFLVSSIFSKKSTFLNSIQYPPTFWTFIREKLWRQQKTYQLECQNCILRVQNNLWRKKVFLEKQVFFDQFLTLSHKNSDFL